MTKAQELEEQVGTLAHAVAHLCTGRGAEIADTEEAIECVETWLVSRGALEPAEEESTDEEESQEGETADESEEAE